MLLRINPVTGCYEEPKPDPMAGMTAEQKEYEAIRLVEMIDKLAKYVFLFAYNVVITSEKDFIYCYRILSGFQ